MKILFRSAGTASDAVQTTRASIIGMADFLVALGIVGFALVLLGLVWALDRV